MREIRKLAGDEFAAFVRITVNAYPGFPFPPPEEHQRMAGRYEAQAQQPGRAFYGVFESGTMLGGMQVFDFVMNVHGIQMPAEGVGLVAVDLLRKKEHAARDLLRFFLDLAKEKGAALTLLYPFRPDFYKQMGFGYGTKLSEYRVPPAGLPQGASKQHLVWLAETDSTLVLDCYRRYQAQRHGLLQRTPAEITRLLTGAGKSAIGYQRDGQILGYLVYGFHPDEHGNPLINDLHVEELVYETPEALAELLSFLRSQADQVRLVVIRTQEDEFHHLLLDPRNAMGMLLPSIYHSSNVQGVGLMYRVIDVPGIFDQLSGHNFGGQSCRVKLTLTDSFYPANAGSWVIDVREGVAAVRQDATPGVEIRLDVAEFSSLLLGTVSFASLYRYHLADLSDPAYLDTINRLFLVPEKPICLTAF